MTTIANHRSEARIAHDAIRGAELEYEQALVRAFPQGHRITYKHGHNFVLCDVIRVCGTDLVVRGARSDKEYRIGAYRALFK